MGEPAPTLRRWSVPAAERRLSRIRVNPNQVAPTQDVAEVQRVTYECADPNGRYKARWKMNDCPSRRPYGSFSQDGHTVKKVWHRGCRRPHCKYCRSGYGSKRAKRMWKKKFNYLSKYGWWYFCFPLPEYYRDWAVREKIKHLRDLVRIRLMRYIREKRALLGHDLELGMIECMHPEGDKDPGVWKPHFNFVVPAVAFGEWREPKTGTPYAYKELKLWWKKEDLADLRQLWADAIGDVFGIRPPVSDVFVEYRTKPQQQRHLLKYVLRSFPGWPQWSRRVYSYGYLADRQIGKFRALWEIGEPEPYSSKPECQKCHEYLELRDPFEGELEPWDLLRVQHPPPGGFPPAEDPW